MLRELCQRAAALPPEDIRRLEAAAEQLPLMAELTGCDVFIDCPAAGGQVMVVAQARPSSSASAYRESVVGQFALPEKEPAVFRALELNAPVRDIKAVTQEDRAVRQDVVPIAGASGRCIAVLIQEKDISENLMQEKKFEELARSHQQTAPSLRAGEWEAGETGRLREAHHRVKNSLQMVASILSLQSRRCGDETAKKILQENVGRVLSIAAIHDIVTQNGGASHQVDSMALLEQLRQNLCAFVPEDKRISISLSGDAVPLPGSAAGCVALAVNELVTNALEHAFSGRSAGEIRISFCAGCLFHTVTVEDDGTGFDVFAPRDQSLGLNLVQAAVQDRLHGHLSVHSDSRGSRVSFDLKTE